MSKPGPKTMQRANKTWYLDNYLYSENVHLTMNLKASVINNLRIKAKEKNHSQLNKAYIFIGHLATKHLNKACTALYCT